MPDHNAIDSFLHGPNSKLFMAGGAVAAIVVVRQYRKSKLTTPAATPATTDSTPVDSSYGGSDYSSYGSADTAGLFTASGYLDPSSGTVITPGSGVAGPVLNSQWVQTAEAALAQAGYDPNAVAAALGHYIVGTPMTQAQDEIRQAAIALEGYPPQPVPPVNVIPSSGGTGATAQPVDGYYVQVPFMLYYQVQGGKLFNLRPATVAKLKSQHVTFKSTLVNNPIYRLPKGTPNPV